MKLDELKSLYSLTGNVLDHNTMLVNRGELRAVLAEVDRLRELLQLGGPGGHSHQCRKCLVSYSPGGENEDCPACHYDGMS